VVVTPCSTTAPVALSTSFQSATSPRSERPAGESRPVPTGPGATGFGATINRSGGFRYKATKVGADTALAQIARLVEDAQTGKAPIQRLADRISGVFVPIVLGLAVHALITAPWQPLGRPRPDLREQLRRLDVEEPTSPRTARDREAIRPSGPLEALLRPVFDDLSRAVRCACASSASRTFPRTGIDPHVAAPWNVRPAMW